MRLERARYRPPLANGGIDVVEKVGRIGGVEVGGLAGVDDRSAPQRQIAVEPAFGGESGGGKKGLVGRFDLDLVVDHRVESRCPQGVGDLDQAGQCPDTLVGKQGDPAHAQGFGVFSGFLEHAVAKADAGNVDREDALRAFAWQVVVVTTGHLPILLKWRYRFAPGFSVARNTIPVLTGARCQLITPVRAGVHLAAVRCIRKSKSSAPALSIARPGTSRVLEPPCADCSRARFRAIVLIRQLQQKQPFTMPSD